MWAVRTNFSYGSSIPTVLASFYCLLLWDLYGHQDLFSSYGKFIKKLSKFHLVSASKQTNWWRQGTNCLQLWAEAELWVRHGYGSWGTQLLCEQRGSRELCKVLRGTGGCWLQTACAQNQFLLCHFSFASFVHPAVLHTKFMSRYHQPFHCPDDILC